MPLLVESESRFPSPKEGKMLMTLRLSGFNKLGGTTFQCLDHRVIYSMVK